MVELLVCVVIIGLIVGVVIAPKVGNSMDKAITQRTQALIDELNGGVINYRVTYPTASTAAWSTGDVAADAATVYAAIKPFLIVPLNRDSFSDFIGTDISKYYTLSWETPSGGSTNQFLGTPKTDYSTRLTIVK